MRRVLLVGKAAPERGGIATFLSDCLEAEWDGVEVTLLNLAHDGPRQGGRASLANVRRTALDARRLLAAARHADVVHIHSALAPGPTLVRAGALCVTARLARRTVILHAHGGRLVDWSNSAGRRGLLRACSRAAHHVVAVSSSLGRTFAEAGVTVPVHVAANGVDTRRFTPLNEQKPTAAAPQGEIPMILYVGHLSERKGVMDLLAASALLETRHVSHRLCIVGGVPDEGGNDESLIRAAATESTRLIGPVEHGEMPALYQSADLFCLPSWWEAAPLSVLEAMASGLAVVATAVGDVQAMVGETGVVIPARRPDALAKELERLLLDPTECCRLGRTARERVVAHYALDQVIAGLARLYREGA